MPNRLRTFDSGGAIYDEVFRIFLSHTDQKRRTRAWLEQFIPRLKSTKLVVDVGAGEGSVLKGLIKSFDRAIAIEPNPHLCSSLRKLANVKVIEQQLTEEIDIRAADLVLCSHVLYLIEPTLWTKLIKRMSSWLSKNGALVVINQNMHTDCRNMFTHFFDKRNDLMLHFDEIVRLEEEGFSITVETIPSYITAPDLRTAAQIAEFLLGGEENRAPVKRKDVREYLRTHHKFGKTGYRLSCHQDFLIVSRR